MQRLLPLQLRRRTGSVGATVVGAVWSLGGISTSSTLIFHGLTTSKSRISSP